MRPVAYIVVYPTKLSVVESLLYTRFMRPLVHTLAMQSMLQRLNALGVGGGEFITCMSAMWSIVNESPSWRLRTSLDKHEGLDAGILSFRHQLLSSIHRSESVLCMATPTLVQMLLDYNYRLVFLETDTSHLSNEEIKACFPKHMEGVCGEWLKTRVNRRALGTVIDSISIPA